MRATGGERKRYLTPGKVWVWRWYTGEGIHHKAAVIDRSIAWEGSLNILQHGDSGEQMTRHEDPGYIKELMDVLGVK